MPQFVNLKIKRQAGPESEPYWEEFRVRYRPNMNVIICLMDIRRNPANSRDLQVPMPTFLKAWQTAPNMVVTDKAA